MLVSSTLELILKLIGELEKDFTLVLNDAIDALESKNIKLNLI
jgi:hypothetical protein